MRRGAGNGLARHQQPVQRPAQQLALPVLEDIEAHVGEAQHLVHVLGLGLVIAVSAAINRLSAATATALFLLYAALNGVTFSVIFAVYTAESIASSEASPCASATSVRASMSMFARASIWSTRYRDMLFSRPCPRQRIVTLRAWVEKLNAA